MLVEKKVTLAVIFAVAAESAGVFMWAGATSEKLKEVEAGIADQADMAERLARVEVHLELAGEQLTRIENKLDAAKD
jgi:hypothetical protein